VDFTLLHKAEQLTMNESTSIVTSNNSTSKKEFL